jgi:hypothetical protein
MFMMQMCNVALASDEVQVGGLCFCCRKTIRTGTRDNLLEESDEGICVVAVSSRLTGKRTMPSVSSRSRGIREPPPSSDGPTTV